MENAPEFRKARGGRRGRADDEGSAGAAKNRENIRFSEAVGVVENGEVECALGRQGEVGIARKGQRRADEDGGQAGHPLQEVGGGILRIDIQNRWEHFCLGPFAPEFVGAFVKVGSWRGGAKICPRPLRPYSPPSSSCSAGWRSGRRSA